MPWSKFKAFFEGVLTAVAIHIVAFAGLITVDIACRFVGHVVATAVLMLVC